MKATHKDIAEKMYNSCKGWSEHVLTTYSDGGKQAALDLQNIDVQELVMVFMWAQFDLLNNNSNLRGKHEKTTHYIFGAYLADWKIKEGEKDAEMARIEKRFYEYKKLFWEGKTKFDMLSVATVAGMNIAGKPDFIFSTALGLSLQEFVIMWGGMLKELEPIQE